MILIYIWINIAFFDKYHIQTFADNSGHCY